MFTLTADLTAVPPEKYITHENHPLHKILYLVQLPSHMPNASLFSSLLYCGWYTVDNDKNAKVA